jgi:hypothetical protein
MRPHEALYGGQDALHKGQVLDVHILFVRMTRSMASNMLLRRGTMETNLELNFRVGPSLYGKAHDEQRSVYSGIRGCEDCVVRPRMRVGACR